MQRAQSEGVQGEGASVWRRWLERLSSVGSRAEDTPELRRAKSTLLLASMLKAAVCPLWYGAYLALGARAAALGPIGYQALTALSIVHFAVTGRFASFRLRQALLILAGPVVAHAGLGGFVSSGGVLLWVLFAPLMSMLMEGARASSRWLAVCLGLFVVCGALWPGVGEPLRVPAPVASTFFVLNFCMIALITQAGLFHFARRLEQEKEQQVELNQRLTASTAELAGALSELSLKSDQLELASQHKSAFLARVSHELRTPMNAIIGFTRLVLRRSREALPPKQAENLERVLTSANHLLSLINDVLDLSKIEAGRMEMHPEPFALAPLLRECVQMAEPLAQGKPVQVEAELADGLPEVRSDQGKIKQIVINLLGNAIKFTDQGSVRIAARCRGGVVEVAVSDTGIGIARDKLGAVFEEFRQLDDGGRAAGGTGLGLPISRKLARLLGGDVVVESAPGEGSTFTLSFPATLPEGLARAAADEAPAPRPERLEAAAP